MQGCRHEQLASEAYRSAIALAALARTCESQRRCPIAKRLGPPRGQSQARPFGERRRNPQKVPRGLHPDHEPGPGHAQGVRQWGQCPGHARRVAQDTGRSFCCRAQGASCASRIPGKSDQVQRTNSCITGNADPACQGHARNSGHRQKQHFRLTGTQRPAGQRQQSTRLLRLRSALRHTAPIPERLRHRLPLCAARLRESMSTAAWMCSSLSCRSGVGGIIPSTSRRCPTTAFPKLASDAPVCAHMGRSPHCDAQRHRPIRPGILTSLDRHAGPCHRQQSAQTSLRHKSVA